MNRRVHEGARLAALFAITTAVGCASSGPVPTGYILGDHVSTRPEQASVLGKPVVEVKPALLPDYLDTTDIVVRRADGSLVASHTGRWGQRLSVGMTQAVTMSLGARLPNVDVTASPTEDRPWQQILIDVDAFELEPNGECVLQASWVVRSARGGRAIDRQLSRFVERVPAQDDVALVAAMSREADALADSIAQSLRVSETAGDGDSEPALPRRPATGRDRRPSSARQAAGS